MGGEIWFVCGIAFILSCCFYLISISNSRITTTPLKHVRCVELCPWIFPPKITHVELKGLLSALKRFLTMCGALERQRQKKPVTSSIKNVLQIIPHKEANIRMCQILYSKTSQRWQAGNKNLSFFLFVSKLDAQGADRHSRLEKIECPTPTYEGWWNYYVLYI